MRSSSREPRSSARAPNSRATSRARALRSTPPKRQLDPARVELGEVEQVGRQLGQALDLLAHRAHELVPLLRARVLFFEQLDEAAEAEDRRAQLVRGVGDELLAGAVELGEPALHLVEGAGQLAELAAGVDRDADGEVAVGDGARGVLDPAHPPGDELGRVEAQREGDQAGDQAADEDRAARRGVALDRDHPDVDDDRGADADRQGRGRDPVAERSEAQSLHSRKR